MIFKSERVIAFAFLCPGFFRLAHDFEDQERIDEGRRAKHILMDDVTLGGDVQVVGFPMWHVFPLASTRVKGLNDAACNSSFTCLGFTGVRCASAVEASTPAMTD